jgi:hypothetical protein
VFGLNIEDEAVVKVAGGTSGAIDGKRLTLRNVWQLVESARGSVKQSSGGSSGGLSRGSR